MIIILQFETTGIMMLEIVCIYEVAVCFLRIPPPSKLQIIYQNVDNGLHCMEKKIKSQNEPQSDVVETLLTVIFYFSLLSSPFSEKI